MFRVFSWYAWRNRLITALVMLLAVCGVGEAALTANRPAAGTPVTEGGVVLPVIMYHGLLPEKNRQNTYVIDPALLESDLQYIRQSGYTTVLVQDLLDYVDKGTPLPEKPILLTFDDGYYNNYLYAYPLLQTYGMKAVISPIVRWSAFYSDTPGESNRPLYSHITWEQMREMTASGLVEMQNHSYDLHHNESGGRKGAQMVSGETVEQYQRLLREDLQRAQTILTEKAGLTPVAFTYPFGEMNAAALPVLRELGFRATLTSEGRVNVLTRSPDSLYGLGRYLRPNTGDSKRYFDKIFRAADAARTPSNQEDVP